MKNFNNKNLAEVNRLKNNFFEEGYIILKNYINRNEISEMLYSINEIIEEALSAAKIKLKNKKNSNILTRIANNYTVLKKKNKKMRSSAYDALKFLSSVNCVFYNSNLEKFLKKTFKTTFLIDNSQVRIDDPSNDRILSLHQEMDQMSLKNITAWIPLQNIGNKNQGGIVVIPRSHLNGYIRELNYQDPKEVGKKFYNKNSKFLSKTKLLKINAGDLLLFHPLLIHGSAQNKSKKTRWTLIARFNSIKTLRLFKDGEKVYSRGSKDYEIYNNQKFYRN